MPMTDEQSADIAQLRTAAESREWTTAQDTFKRLLATLDPLIALSVVAPRVQAFLPKFEHYYPEAGWVRELMLTVIVYGSAPSDLPFHALRDFPRPGCGNFLIAVFEMAQVVQPQTTTFESYSHITNAAGNAILADLQYTYFKKRLELYQIYRDEQTDDETRQAIQFEFWLNEIVSKRDVALWLHMADQIEQAINRN